MAEVILVLAVVLVVLIAGSLLCKRNPGWMSGMILLAALLIPFVTGQGLHWREVVEGPFAYLDNAMWILCAAIFIFYLYENGTFDFILNRILAKKRGAFVQTMLLLLLIALPGMFTGTASITLLTTGLLVGKALVNRGMEKKKVAELVAVGAFFGMLLPPVSLPGIIVVISRQGTYPASFEGYFVPLLLMALPAMLVYAGMASKRLMQEVQFGGENKEKPSCGKATCLLPLIVVALLLIGHNFFYSVMPFLGYPVIYCIGAILALILPATKRAKPVLALSAVEAAAPALAVMFACGALSENLTLTGANGTIASYMYQSSVPDLYVIVAGIVLLVAGFFLGAPAAAALSIIPGYFIGTHYYTEAFMVLIAVGGILAVSFFLQSNGGIISRAGEVVECEKLKAADVLKPMIVPLCIVLAVCLVFLFGTGTLDFLMV